MNEISIIKKENIQMIVQSAPQSFADNQLSHDRCIEACERILSEIESVGMNDQTDQQAAILIEKARKTVKKMNDKRSAVTKLFDDIRTRFTSLENDIDPTKKDTIPHQLQQFRNSYAAEKRAAAERKAREEAERQRHSNDLQIYRTDAEDFYRTAFNRGLNAKIDNLNNTFKNVTIDNYNSSLEEIRHYPCVLSQKFADYEIDVISPSGLTAKEISDIDRSVRSSLYPKFAEQFKFDVESNRDSLLDLMPSKLQELKRIAQAADVEEQKRIAEEMKAREAEEARKKEDERRRKEEEDKRQQQLKRQNVEAASLFDNAQSSVQDYQPKATVKKKIVPLDSEAFLAIISLWWSREGGNLSVEELSKIFKKQLTFCEKLANDKTSPTLIQSVHVTYQDDVKAK